MNDKERKFKFSIGQEIYCSCSPGCDAVGVIVQIGHLGYFIRNNGLNDYISAENARTTEVMNHER